MRREQRYPKRRKQNTLLVVGILVMLALSLVGLLGGLGDAIKGFLTGAFGFLAYAVVAVAALFTIIKGFRFVRRKGTARTVALIALLTVIALTYVQIITSFKLYSEIAEPAYGTYLTACFDAGMETSGGLVTGILAYPLLAAMGKYSAIPLAVLFFIVLFFTLLPLMRAPKSEGERASAPAKRESSRKKERKGKAQAEPLRLFVDKVSPGQKDAAVIKRKGLFSKPTEEYTLFDVYDTSAFIPARSAAPASNPEKYNAFRDEPKPSYDYEDDYESDLARDYTATMRPPVLPTEPPKSTRLADDFSSQSDADLPLFVKKRAGERAEANKKLYGEDRVRDVLPDEPTYEQEPAPKKVTLKPTPLVDVPKKPKARGSADIIEDINDLKRVNEKNAWKKQMPRYLGENEETPAAPKAVTPAEETPTPKVEPRTFAEPLPMQEKKEPSISERYTPAPEAPAPALETKEPEPPDYYEEDVPGEEPSIEPEPEEEVTFAPRKPEPPVPPTITPREASYTEPTPRTYSFERETPKPAPEPRPERPTSFARSEQPSFLKKETPSRTIDYRESEEDDVSSTFPVRQRKPRSDIGGTHRTESKAEMQYIPPKNAEQVRIDEPVVEEPPARPYSAPPVKFLKEYPPMQDEEGVDERAESLVQALASFNIASEVVDHKSGPTFTQFAVTLPSNMSVNKLTPLEKDIKRKMMISKNIRIIPSVPGLDAVGIEVPNKETSTIGLRSLINSPNFEKENKLYFAIGVDVSGQPVYGDLLKMPHLLVAGSTGSGKSVCLNVMICSMLYHYSPEFVRFIMIDPKKVELSIYRNMPHMVMPNTVTDVNKAINALTWAVNEMERRYDLLQESECRSIVEYNELQAKKGGKKLYYIVLIVDEMADLMSRAKRDVEDKIQSLTSKARAAGIHLVVATQRPSVDVITGTIKNNIPNRIAFKVTSMNDSRTILEKSGAESLFGNGDMLYCPSNGEEPSRLQGPFISSSEVAEIVEYIKAHNDCRFDNNAETFIQADKQAEQDAAALPTNTENGSDEDEIFADALLYVIESGQASISKLQRKFRLGYSRAARIVDVMEDRGFIGPTDASNKPRAVLITLDEYYALYGDDGIEGGESR